MTTDIRDHGGSYSGSSFKINNTTEETIYSVDAVNGGDVLSASGIQSLNRQTNFTIGSALTNSYIVWLSDTKFLVFYFKNSATKNYVRVFNMATPTSTPVMGTEQVLPGYSNLTISASQIDANNVLVITNNNGVNSSIFILTLDANDIISTSTPVTVANSNMYKPVLFKAATNKYFWMYTYSNSYYACIIDVTNNVVTVGTPTTLFSNLTTVNNYYATYNNSTSVWISIAFGNASGLIIYNRSIDLVSNTVSSTTNSQTTYYNGNSITDVYLKKRGMFLYGFVSLNAGSIMMDKYKINANGTSVGGIISGYATGGYLDYCKQADFLDSMMLRVFYRNPNGSPTNQVTYDQGIWRGNSFTSINSTVSYDSTSAGSYHSVSYRVVNGNHISLVVWGTSTGTLNLVVEQIRLQARLLQNAAVISADMIAKGSIAAASIGKVIELIP